jgi:hypothetical protein
MRSGGISREEVDGRSLRRRGHAVRADCTMAGKVRSGSVPEGVQKAGSGGSLEQAEVSGGRGTMNGRMGRGGGGPMVRGRPDGRDMHRRLAQVDRLDRWR